MRFPEFNESWEWRKLKNLCSKVGSGKTPKGGENIYRRTGIPFIRSQNVIENSLEIDDTCIPANIHLEMSNSVVLPNDILLNITGASIGRSCVVPNNFKEGNVNQHVSIIRLKKYNPYFLQSIISSRIGQKAIFQTQTGSGREGLNFESIKNFQFYFPDLREQEKIASFISLINERISTQNKIIRNLESLMYGTKKQIFDQNLRFKNSKGITSPNWEKRKLGDLSVIKRGASPRPIGSSKWFSKISKVGWVRISDVTAARITLKRTTQYLSEKGISKSRFVPKGNIIMSICATIGKPIFTGIDVCIHDGFVVFEKLKVDKLFFYYLLQHLELKWLRYGQPGIQLNLNSDIVSNENVWVPCKEEQLKIAQFLFALDEKINREKQVLNQYKKQKKYLLQNMLI